MNEPMVFRGSGSFYFVSSDTLITSFGEWFSLNKNDLQYYLSREDYNNLNIHED